MPHQSASIADCELSCMVTPSSSISSRSVLAIHAVGFSRSISTSNCRLLIVSVMSSMSLSWVDVRGGGFEPSPSKVLSVHHRH